MEGFGGGLGCKWLTKRNDKFGFEKGCHPLSTEHGVRKGWHPCGIFPIFESHIKLPLMKDLFNTSLADSQATKVEPISADKFDLSKYSSYENELSERCLNFTKAKSGVLVYRRMRVKEVFAEDCGDMEKSLQWQLGALEKSLVFKSDIPNFLEPWYGLGTVASAFGMDYVWEKGQAPAVKGKFDSTLQLLEAGFVPVAETAIGKHTLQMTEYFMEKTKGLLPMSYCDIQSPLNTLSNVIESNQFYMDFYMDPESMSLALDKCADLLIDFTKIQRSIIGDALVKPGHGFASSRLFEGMGMSDDSVTMLPSDLYFDMVVPSMIKAGNYFGGTGFHSCGNWSDKMVGIAGIQNIRVADGAFSLATDPGANATDGFADAFVNTGVVLNARIVGDTSLITEKVKALWKPGMKLIVVTYCETPEEQAEVYDIVHGICR